MLGKIASIHIEYCHYSFCKYIEVEVDLEILPLLILEIDKSRIASRTIAITHFGNI